MSISTCYDPSSMTVLTGSHHESPWDELTIGTARNKTLLFAEDDPALLDLYSYWFKLLGYDVLAARNGREALSLCWKQPVDLVVSDVQMPGGDGIEFVRRLQATLRTPPRVMFLTGVTDLSNEEAYYDLGACAILTKPVELQVLEHVVERFLKSPQELWASPPSWQPKAFVEKEYESLQRALEQRELSFGNGGMFLRDCEVLPENVALGFRLHFAEGSVARIDGCGFLRWQRVVAHPELPLGAGIEILYLAKQALDPVAEWISRANPKAFIPRG